jgi:hypothetical protein
VVTHRAIRDLVRIAAVSSVVVGSVLAVGPVAVGAAPQGTAPTAAAPAAAPTDVTPVQIGYSHFRVYARGTDGRVWWTTVGSGAWHPFAGAAGSGPSAIDVAATPDENDINTVLFAKGTGGNLITATQIRTVNSAWTSLGGALTSAPAADVDRGTGDVYVAARGTDGAIWLRHRIGTGTWDAWRSVGGQATSAPSITIGPGGVFVAVRGTDGQIWQRSISPTQSWTNRRIATSSAPAIDYTNTSNGWVFSTAWRNSGNSLVLTYSPGTTVSPGGYLTSGPALYVDGFEGPYHEVYVRGGDNAVWRYIHGPGTSAWSSLGGSII